MTTFEARVPVLGSARRLVLCSQVVGDVDGTERITVTACVHGDPAARSWSQVEEFAMVPSVGRPKIDPLGEGYSLPANQQDLDAVSALAYAYNLDVLEMSVPERSLLLAGTNRDFSKAFGVNLEHWTHAGPRGSSSSELSQEDHRPRMMRTQ